MLRISALRLAIPLLGMWLPISLLWLRGTRSRLALPLLRLATRLRLAIALLGLPTIPLLGLLAVSLRLVVSLLGLLVVSLLGLLTVPLLGLAIALLGVSSLRGIPSSHRGLDVVYLTPGFSDEIRVAVRSDILGAFAECPYPLENAADERDERIDNRKSRPLAERLGEVNR